MGSRTGSEPTALRRKVHARNKIERAAETARSSKGDIQREIESKDEQSDR